MKEKSIVTNAKTHIGARDILNIDLKNFFDTINFGRVRGMFLGEPFKFNNEVSTILAKIVCDNNKLPQGAPSSPVIANMICYILDNNLSKYCDKHGCIYTRYADDITISSKSYKFPKQIARKDVANNVVLGDKIVKIIEEESGFTINKEKVKFSRKMQRQEVTGLIINEKINVKRIYIKKLRALLHNCKINGIKEEAKKYFSKEKYNDEIALFKYQKVIEGKLNFLKMVRGEYDTLFLKYAKEYNDIIGKEVFDIDSIKETREYIEERIGVINSSDEMSQGTIQFVEEYGAITSTHIYINEDIVKEDYEEIMNNTYEYPVKCDSLYFFTYRTNKDRNTRLIPLPDIFYNNVKMDIIKLKIDNKKKFKINVDDEITIGKKVIVAGYAEFIDFDKSSILIQDAEVIAERQLFGINVKCINKPIYHGMSGGPVLNENREVIGIIYYGENDNQGINNAFIPISSVIDILQA